MSSWKRRATRSPEKHRPAERNLPLFLATNELLNPRRLTRQAMLQVAKTGTSLTETSSLGS